MDKTLKNLILSITKKEWWLVIAVVFLVIIITAAPFLYGYLTRPNDTVFTGLHHLAPGDTNVFLSMIEQVKQGENIFINLYTSEPQSRALINPLWLSVGWGAKIFNLPNLTALHLARSLWIGIFFFVLYLFISYFISNSRSRKWILLMVAFSSGLGLFFNPFLFDVNNIYEHPTDIWVAESITFLSLLHSPHLIASLTLILLAFLLTLLAFDTNRLRYSIGAGVTSFFLLWFHPFNGPTVFGVLLFYILLLFARKREIIWTYLKHYLVVGIIASPAAVYLLLLSQRDWVIRNWSAQNILPSPSVWMYIIGYGIILWLAFVGVYYVLKQRDNKSMFFVVWAATSAILLYIPVDFQRRMSEGLHIPLVFLAFFGSMYMLQHINVTKVARRTVFVMVLVIFLPLTNIQIVGQDIHLFQSKKTLPYYLYQDEVTAMQWLRDNVSIDEVTFSSYYMGNYIPAYSGRVVWIGHGPQTIDLPDKHATMQWFWENQEEGDAKQEFLDSWEIDWVWYGRKEKELGSYSPASAIYLQLEYSNSQVELYRVIHSQSE